MLTRLLIAVFGAAVATIGAIAVIGYAANKTQLYDWLVNRQAMAFNTAVSFVLVGIALLAVGVSNRIWNTGGK